MKINVVGPFQVNAPFATEIAFSKGLRQIGHEVVEFDPNVDSPDVMDRQADFTLVFKNALQHNDRLLGLKNVVLYQPDDLRFPHIQAMVSEMRRYSDHLITFRKIPEAEIDVRYFLRQIGFKSTSPLAVTADPDIYYPEEVEKDVDFCFVGSMGDMRCHWQRHSMVEMLRIKGYKVLYGQTQDLDEIRRAYNRSKVVINHASDNQLPFGLGYGYQCRHFEVGLTRGCLLSNQVLDDDPQFIENFVRFGGDQEFRELADMLIADDEWRDIMSSKLYDEVMERHSPAVRARQLVEILERL